MRIRPPQHARLDAVDKLLEKCRRNDQRGPFSKSIYGFAHFQITPEKTIVRFIGEDGRMLHAFERNRAGSVKVLADSPSDKATTCGDANAPPIV